MNDTRNLATLVLALTGLAVGAAHAQGNEAPLRGPEVRPSHAPGVQTRYAPDEGGRPGDRPVPLPVFLDIVRTLAAEPPESERRLTPDQSDRIRAEARAFAREVDAYVRAVQPEVDVLLERLPVSERRRAAREWGAAAAVARGAALLEQPPARRRSAESSATRQGAGEEPDGGRDPGGPFHLEFRRLPPAMPSPEGEPGMRGMAGAGDEAPMDDTLARLRELGEGVPSPGELQTRIWAVLSDAQHEFAEKALAAHRDRVRSEAEERRLARMQEQRPDAAVSPEAGGAGDRLRPLDEAAIRRIVNAFRGGEFPALVWSRLPDRAQQRLEALEPEERARAVERLLRARGARGSAPDTGVKDDGP